MYKYFIFSNKNKLISRQTDGEFIYLALESSLESQSNPSYKPVPCVAHVDWMYHCKVCGVCGGRV